MEYLKKYKKWLISFLLLLFFLIGCFVFYNHYVYRLELINKVFTYEYGEKINLKLENYLIKETHKDILEYAKVESNIKNEEGKDYPQIGEYNATIKYKKNKVQFTIKIVDTKKPEWITHPSTLYIEQNAEDVKLEDYFKANDLNKVHIKIQDSNLNIKKIGQYKATVVAEDKYKNRNEQKITVHVVTYNDSTKKKLSQTIQGKIPESEKTRREREIQESKKKSINAGNKPKNNLCVSSNSSVSNGQSIRLTKYEEYVFPKKIPQGNLTFNQYDILKKFYKFIIRDHNSNNRTIDIYNCSKEDLKIAMNHLNSYLGDELRYKILLEETDERDGYHIQFFLYITEFFAKHPINDRLNLAYKACLKAGLKDGMNEKHAVKKINDWICSHMSFVVNHGEADVGFKTGKGQCKTYAQMFSDMCKVAGIQCAYVSGYAEGADGWGTHAWNKVKIGNAWYYIDTTWNDSPPKNRYYLTKTLWSDHKVR